MSSGISQSCSCAPNSQDDRATSTCILGSVLRAAKEVPWDDCPCSCFPAVSQKLEIVQRVRLAGLLTLHTKHCAEDWPVGGIEREDRLDCQAPHGSFSGSCSDEHAQTNLACIGSGLSVRAHCAQRIHGCASFAAHAPQYCADAIWHLGMDRCCKDVNACRYITCAQQHGSSGVLLQGRDLNSC